VPTADWIERLLELGVRTIQLRTKSDDGAFLDAEIARAVTAARAHDARLFINDHWQRAIDAGAYGVHLGQEDLQTADLGAIARAGLRLGLSTHGFYEMLVALHFRPSYLAMGAVFPTTTKQMPTAPQGLVRLAHYVALLRGKVPLVAIGGIDAAVIDAVLATGVGSAAVVRAVTEAADLPGAVRSLQGRFA
jgi:thiamine-phosphate pyrophosphorylase